MTKEDEKSSARFDPLASDSSDNEEEGNKKTTAREMTRLKFFEKQLTLKPKGFFKIWMTEFDLGSGEKVKVFLHAINDAKPVFRISTKHAGLPTRALEITDRDKSTGIRVKKTLQTSPAHWSFRKYMGFNDQSDAKRSLIGLSAKYYKH